MFERVMSEPQNDDEKISARRFRFLTVEQFQALSPLEKAEYARAARLVTLERGEHACPPPKIWDELQAQATSKTRNFGGEK